MQKIVGGLTSGEPRGASAGSNSVQPRILGELPEKHTYVWHVTVAQQTVRHEAQKVLLRKSLGILSKSIKAETQECLTFR